MFFYFSLQEKIIASVVVADDKLITIDMESIKIQNNGVNDTAINTKLWISPRIFIKIRNGTSRILRGQGETDSWKNLKSKSRVRLPLEKVSVWGYGKGYIVFI
jgi:hypothetical protein